MFEIGDLVQFRKEGAFTKTREHPDKKIGLITINLSPLTDTANYDNMKFIQT